MATTVNPRVRNSESKVLRLKEVREMKNIQET